MTTPISLKSTRLEILLEVTEDRGIESGRWDLERQITLPSTERVGADLRKKRTGEWGSRKSVPLCFFPMLSVCLREVFGLRARRGVSEGYTESAKNLERGVRIHPHPDSTFHIPHSRRQESMEISSIEVLLACLGCQYYYSTNCEMLANLTAKNSDWQP